MNITLSTLHIELLYVQQEIEETIKQKSENMWKINHS